MNARYYDPSSGRFASQDPMGFAAGDDNLYAYVGNGPYDAVDPTGELFLEIALITGAVLAAGAGATAIAANNSDSFAGFLADAGGDLAEGSKGVASL